MTLEDRTCDVARVVAEHASMPPASEIVARGRRRQWRQRGAVGLLAGVGSVALVAGAVGLPAAQPPDGEFSSGPQFGETASTGEIQALAATARAQTSQALEPGQAIYLEFTAAEERGGILGGPEDYELWIAEDGSAQRSNEDDGVTLTLGTTKDSLPSYAVPPDLILRLNDGTTSATDALEELGSRSEEGTVDRNTGLVAAARLLAMPGVEASARGDVLDALASLNGVEVLATPTPDLLGREGTAIAQDIPGHGQFVLIVDPANTKVLGFGPAAYQFTMAIREQVLTDASDVPVSLARRPGEPSPELTPD